MAKYVIEDTTLTGIAGAIREKNGTTDTMKPTEMAAAIAAIVSGGSFEGFNSDEYTISIIHTASYVDVSDPFMTNWKDYCSSIDDIEFFAFKIQQNFCGFYFKGVCPKYNDTRVGYYSLMYGSYSKMSCKTPPAKLNADTESSGGITTNTIEINDAGWATDYSIGGYPAIFLITKKRGA